MGARVIDYDRGVVIRQMASTGMDVYMYVEEPGVFLDAFGREVPESIAREAGFNTERLSKERLKRERMKAAFDQISAEIDTSDRIEEVIAERGDYKIVSIGLGRHQVRDSEGNTLTSTPVPLEVAQRLFDALVPEQVAEPKGKKGKAREE